MATTHDQSSPLDVYVQMWFVCVYVRFPNVYAYVRMRVFVCARISLFVCKWSVCRIVLYSIMSVQLSTHVQSDWLLRSGPHAAVCQHHPG